ncbi:RNA-directed DNA polymerase from mobile element jockey [Elysia marginata]|uniref:RNA-directed DNA polymerase from mobile element jockey n=1 Tax=Elysia marginata TaxID=1093978 RepID=A0AAV4I264_9GAST|nr:RNA-directed DNA polymerase from mobile element jockey [Elysia marginata]
MFKWTEQYLQNRKAKVRTQHFKSKTQNMKHGVPQGGISSPTFFSMFMNDIQTIIPKGVYGAIYADDMAIWATEEYTGTAQARLQLALEALRMWTEKWLTKINPEKTTFTTFTLSTTSQTVRLKIREQ